MYFPRYVCRYSTCNTAWLPLGPNVGKLLAFPSPQPFPPTGPKHLHKHIIANKIIILCCLLISSKNHWLEIGWGPTRQKSLAGNWLGQVPALPELRHQSPVRRLRSAFPFVFPNTCHSLCPFLADND